MHGLMMGGLEQLVVRLCTAGRQYGVEPMVIAFGAGGSVEELLAEHRIPVAHLGRSRGMSPQTINGIASALRQHRIDIAHAHDMGPWLNTVAARALAPRTRPVVTFHQIATPAGFHRAAATAASLISDALIACGNEVRACLEGWTPPGIRLELIGNGVPIGPTPTAEERARARARMKVPEDAVVIGYLGRLHEEKGCDLLIDAFIDTLSRREDVHLVMIGRGLQEEELHARVRQSGVKRVHFLGEIVSASSLLPGFDIYVQPSRREGRSLSMLEAMAAGLPTVAQGLPPIREIHVDGDTALLVPPGPKPPFAAAISRLIDDPALRQRMGERARAHVRTFSIEAMAEAYAQLYRDVMVSGRRWPTPFAPLARRKEEAA